MQLYAIKQNYLWFLEQVAQGEVPEEAINDTLEAIEGEFEEKADNIACFIKSLTYEANAIKTEIDLLSERMKQKQAKADKLIEYLYKCMKDMDKSKIETARNLLQIKQNPPSVEVDIEFVKWAQEHADHLLDYKDPTPKKSDIKALLKTQELPHCQLVQGEKLHIK